MKTRQIFSLIIMALLILSGCSEKTEPKPKRTNTASENYFEVHKKIPAGKEPQGLVKRFDILKEMGLDIYNDDLLVSPDGELAAFSGFSGGKAEQSAPDAYKLVIVDLGTGATTAIAHGRAVKVLAWTPDSKKVLYSDNGLYLIELAGKKKYRLSETASNGTISPDGKYIAFTENSQGLFIIRPDETGKKQLAGAGAGGRPLWYPDGKKIFYFSGNTEHARDKRQVPAAVSLSSGRRTMLLSGESGVYQDARWISPGKTLLITKKQGNTLSGFIYDLSGQKVVSLGELPKDEPFSFTVDGKNGRLLKAGEGKTEIFDVTGNKVVNFQLDDGILKNYDYSVSPDGERVAYLYGVPGSGEINGLKGRRVWVAGFEGQNPLEVTPSYGAYYSPRWAGENSLLVVENLRNGEDRYFKLFLISLSKLNL
ncbi:MAG: TolB family protein [Bacillota bacterium]